MQEITLDSNRQSKTHSVCCYICGREFGTKGYSFHYKECLLKFNHEQERKAPNDRIKLPSPPEFINQVLANDFSKINLNKFNQDANNIYKYKVLPSCKFCKRTFNSESLFVHMKGCAKKPSGYQEKQNEVISSIAKGPKALVCCVCGQRFGTSSLRIHYPQCRKKFKNEEIRKHKKECDRMNPPEFTPEDYSALFKQDWSNEQLEEFNSRATENYRRHGMAECQNCGRKFFFQQLNKHRKNCELINGKLNKGKKKIENETKTLKIARPKTITCIICGRDYGITSISIHKIQCQDLFEKQQANKVKHKRKQLPSLSQEQNIQYNLGQVENWSRQKIEKYNKIAFDVYNNKSLSKCFICQRSFFEESLPKHLKDCQSKLTDVRKLQKFKNQIKSNKSFFGGNFLQNVMKMNRQLSTPQLKVVKKPRVLMCLLCGKEYGLTSLKIHLKRCRSHVYEKKEEAAAAFEQIRNNYNIDEAEKWSEKQIEAYNSEVYEIYKVKSLFQCKYCHRTFFQQSLKKHIKHCQKENNNRALKKSKTATLLPSSDQLISEQDEAGQLNMRKQQSQPMIIEEEGQHSDSAEKSCQEQQYGKLMTDEFQQSSMDIQEGEGDQMNFSVPTIEIEDF